MIAYRLLTGDDSSAFCHKVTEALDKGWSLYGSPSYAYDATSGVMRCAQAVTKEVPGDYDPEKRLGTL
ncbi:DUF1737 domain-containing protein [Oceanibium sediminis]|uniref:DUF1737 domain-containing protein n=1 Tax=Oceanibium sediminis TaxID=2026339 RepID=UPI000DD4AFA4|nr:DUF1737 domain-containing protein [Oceanibium sediminis]